MAPYRNLLVFHTAFIGDIILTLPLLQELRANFPDSRITVVVIPAAANVLRNHPAVDEVIEYDKKGSARGFTGILKMAGILRSLHCDIALVPHRSIRSALVVSLAGIPRRIGFSKSVARATYTDAVLYRGDIHEIDRNLSLLSPLGILPSTKILPQVHPGASDVQAVDRAIETGFGTQGHSPIVAIAPGSVWNTKRWPEEKFSKLAGTLVQKGFRVVLVGGREDRALCEIIIRSLPVGNALNLAGELTLLQSAELIRRCETLVSNDSAPMHLAVAIGTPVVALFGATIPQFGFAPLGEHDRVMEIPGLLCRPCSIHGGVRCPIQTFVCMEKISPERVFHAVQQNAAVSRHSVVSG